MEKLRYCQISNPHAAITLTLSVLRMTCDVAIFLPHTVLFRNREVLLSIRRSCTLLSRTLAPYFSDPPLYIKDTFSYLIRPFRVSRMIWSFGWLGSYVNFQLNTFLVVMTSYLLDIISNSSLPECNFKVLTG